MPGRPSLLNAVLTAERKLAGPLQRATNSPQAAETILVVARGARLALGAAQRARSAAVHALYLPTRRDVQALETQVERLRRALDELDAGTGGRRDAGPPS